MSSRKIYIPLLAAILISLSAGRAFAYKITPLKHLFDIEHGFLQPSDVAIGKDLRIYVLDGVNSQVKVFSENGSFLFSFGSKGNAQGQFESPLGLANDSTGRIFVADTGKGTLCGMVEVSIRRCAPGCETTRIGYLEGWYVEPGLRGQGIGKHLVLAAEEWAKAQGCTEMASDTNERYPLSRAAHKALGYQETNPVIHFKKDL